MAGERSWNEIHSGTDPFTGEVEDKKIVVLNDPCALTLAYMCVHDRTICDRGGYYSKLCIRRGQRLHARCKCLGDSV